MLGRLLGVSFACLFSLNSGLAADWVSTEKVGNVAYFAVTDPPQLARYDLQARQWLQSVTFTSSRGPLTAVAFDEAGMYVAYDKAVYRYDVTGQSEQHVVNASSTVQGLYLDGNLLLINHPVDLYTRVTSVNRTNHAVVASVEIYVDSVYGATISRSNNRLLGTSDGVSPADVTYVEYRDNGTFVGGGDSPHHGAYDVGSRTWLFPNEGRFADSSGNCYSTTGLYHVLSFGTTITDLQFIGDDVPVVLSGNKIIGYNNALLQVGSATLASSAKSIFVDAGDVLAFSPGSGTSILVQTVPLTAISSPLPGQPVMADGLPFTPDDYFVDSAGLVNLVSKSHQIIFRWDPATQAFVTPISLIGVPDYITYARQSNVIYTAYSSGMIRKLDLEAATILEVPFAQLPTRPRGLAMAGNYLFTTDESGSWDSHYTFDPLGVQVASKDWNYYSKNYVWNEATQKMYFFRDDSSPNDLLWEEINASGSAYAGVVAGGIGIKKDSPLHTSTGFVHPIRLSPAGDKVVLGSGYFHDAITLERAASGLANDFVDAVWLAGQLVSFRSVASNTVQFQQWLEPTFGLGQVLQLPGTPLRLLDIPGPTFVAITRGSDGVPSFYVMDDALILQAPPVLAKPAHVRARVVTTASVELLWQDVSGETGYSVERRILPDGDWSMMATTTTSNTSYLDTTVQAGLAYSYRVTASHGQQFSEPSLPVDIALLVPGKPVVLAAAEGSDRVRVTWEPSARADAYKLYRKTVAASTWTLLTGTPVAGTSYLDNYLSPGTTYQYKLEAVNALGVSAASDVVSATTNLVAPGTPYLYSLSTSNPREVNVQWSSVSLAASYLIERALISDNIWSTLATVTAPASSYLDKTVLPGTAYQYRMYAINSVGTSPVSTVRQVTTPVPVAPAVPGNFRLETLAGPVIKLAWMDGSAEDGYRVDRRVGEGVWGTLVVLAKNSVTYLDDTVTAGTDYSYRVVAFNEVGETFSAELPVFVQAIASLLNDTFDPNINNSNWSALQGAVVRGGTAGFYQGNALWMGASGVRQVVTAPADISLGSAVLKFMFRAGNAAVDGPTNWDNSESNETVYVEYSKPDGAWVVLRPLDTLYPAHSTWTSYSLAVPVAALSSNTRFRWRQLMHSGANFDTWAIDNVQIQGIVPEAPAAPPFFTGNANSSRSIALSWVTAPRATSYEVQRRTPSTSWGAVGTTGLGQTYYADNTVQPSSLYSYRVVAKNAGGTSPPSDYVLISTWSTLAEWRFQNYGTLQDAGDASALADNGTGVPNLFKFAFNMAADDHFYQVQSYGDTKGMPLVQFESESGLLQVAFIRRRAEMNPGIQYEVQFSDNLSTWSAVGVEVLAAPIDEEFEYVVWRDDAPPAGTERKARFGRVKVTE